MFVCMCLCLYLSAFMYVYVCICTLYACVFVCLYLYVCVCFYAYICMCVSVFVCLYLYVCVCICMLIFVRVCLYLCIRMHACRMNVFPQIAISFAEEIASGTRQNNRSYSYEYLRISISCFRVALPFYFQLRIKGRNRYNQKKTLGFQREVKNMCNNIIKNSQP